MLLQVLKGCVLGSITHILDDLQGDLRTSVKDNLVATDLGFPDDTTSFDEIPPAELSDHRRFASLRR